MKNIKNSRWLSPFLWSALGLFLTSAITQVKADEIWSQDFDKIPCCQYEEFPEVVWYGDKEEMTFEQLAAYIAPVLWFSPDEPLLRKLGPEGIQIPTNLPFDKEANTPVVYYRYTKFYRRPGAEKPTFSLNEEDANQSVIQLKRLNGIDLDFFFYYPWEKGLGSHKHDLELGFFKVAVWKRDKCGKCPNALVIIKEKSPAHLVKWYANELVVDPYTVYPLHLFVEEGKHASCPDKNADGYYTPGYDVNRRVNDAWGVRDTLSTGHTFSPSFQAYMAKVRQDKDKVFPPLPEDSPLREKWSVNGVYAPDHNKYVLRPLPRTKEAKPDKGLEKIMKVQTQKDPDWPQEKQGPANMKKFRRWMEADSWTRGLGAAFRVDSKDLGFSLYFPLLIFKNVEMPFGGYLVNRVYLKDTDLRDISYSILYTPSASRFVDWYLTMGYEYDEEKPAGVIETHHNFMSEAGLKFRANLRLVKGAFLINWITDWWGLRLGVKQTGFSGFDSLGWIVEVGAGSF